MRRVLFIAVVFLAVDSLVYFALGMTLGVFLHFVAEWSSGARIAVLNLISLPITYYVLFRTRWGSRLIGGVTAGASTPGP